MYALITYLFLLITQNIFDSSIVYHVDCFRLFFITLLQNDVDDMKTVWNNHYIRCQTNSECPSGRTKVIHYTSDVPGLPNGAKSVDINDIAIVKSFWKENSLFGCSSIFSRFAIDIIKIT